MLPGGRALSGTLCVDGDSDKFSLEGEVTISKSIRESLGDDKSLDWFLGVWKE